VNSSGVHKKTGKFFLGLSFLLKKRLCVLYADFPAFIFIRKLKTIIHFFTMQTENKTQGRIFENAFLESFTKSNPRLTITFYSMLICFFLFLSHVFTRAGFMETFLLYIAGIFSWTLMEYILHRYVFHIDEYFPGMKRLHYMLHGIHHEHPRDHERLFMPPVPGTIIAAILLGFWYLFLGKYAFAFMAGMSNGYLLYSYIHYSVHTKPVFYPLRSLWKHHALHHFKYQDKAFGVSSPLWDIIFKTMPPEKRQVKFKK
jgi:sterol desaturase/sphingolipid hydroxylase (fatty acid hydroxylase superfamily)